MASDLPETTREIFEAIIRNLEPMFDLDTALTGANDFYNSDTTTVPSSVVVADLPTVAGDGQCTVCIEDFRAGEGGKMIPCGHVYHETCISTCLSKDDRCPLCRRRISATG